MPMRYAVLRTTFLFLLGLLLGACSLLPVAPAQVELTPATTESGLDARELTAKPSPTATPTDGLPTILFDRLPRQARDTISLIERGGPFPYRQDGSTFQNREGLLPNRPQGYYREYTVPTPGESDRGARRIIGGREGELYYTDDHYASFKRVAR